MKSIAIKTLLALAMATQMSSGSAEHARVEGDVSLQRYVPAGATIVWQEEVRQGEKIYYRVKFLDETYLDAAEIIIDEKGNIIPEIPRFTGIPSRVGPKLQALLDDQTSEIGVDSRATIVVDVALDLPLLTWEEEPSTGGWESHDSFSEITLNGVNVTEDDVRAHEEKVRNAVKKNREEMQQNRDKILEDVVARNGWEAKPEELHGTRKEKSTFKISLTKDELLSALRRPEGIRWIGILPEEIDQIAGAMLDTNVDPQALSRPTHTGNGTGIFMTEGGCPNPGSIVNYTRLGGINNTLHSQIVGGIVRAVSPDSHLYCRVANGTKGGPILPVAADLGGINNGPPIHIISRSNGFDNNRLYDPLTRDWDNFSYTNNVVIFSKRRQQRWHIRLRKQHRGKSWTRAQSGNRRQL